MKDSLDIVRNLKKLTRSYSRSDEERRHSTGERCAHSGISYIYCLFLLSFNMKPFQMFMYTTILNPNLLY